MPPIVKETGSLDLEIYGLAVALVRRIMRDMSVTLGAEAAPDLTRDLEALGWDAFFAEHFVPFAEACVSGRVAVEHKRGYRVYTELGELPAEVSGRFRHRATGRGDFPVVGDWVAVQPRGEGAWAAVQAMLPRKTRFSRRAAGTAIEEQIVAANVDTVFLVSGLDNDFNPRRIERYLMMARESGAETVIVLSKADLCADLDEKLASTRSLALEVPVHPISSRTREGLQALELYLRRGRTVALLGSSGVGKSTLINTLAGEDLLRTQEVRQSDQRGRHTTTRRELVVLPRGGVIMDTPGMRELQVWDAPDGTGESFEDIDALAEECHFPHCQHRNEPRCAVSEAVAQGALSEARLENYRKIQGELAYLKSQRDDRERLEQKRTAKVATKAFNKHQPRG